MNQPDRTRLYARVGLYAALGLAWAAFARWSIPPRLVAEHPGPFIEALKRYLRVEPAGFLCQDLLGRWREFSDAVLIAMALHLSIVAVLARYDRTAAGGGSAREARAWRPMSLALGIVGAAFLAVAVLSATRQDYDLYLEMWHQVRQGGDPWFIVPGGMNGPVPLNAYGPLFNPMGVLAWINPVAPRLLFSYAYILFAIATTRGFAAGRPLTGLRVLGLLALFWNPFAWVEVAFYGHFDILVGLACLGAVRAWAGGRDIRSGMCLAAGVLLKYLPIVLLPFLALDRDRGRPRLRFVATALAAIVVGLGMSCLVWGPSTFSPLWLAATRRSTSLSIFRFFAGRYSPRYELGLGPEAYENLQALAPLAALGGTWAWSRYRKPDVETSALVAVLVLVLVYRVGYPQYQMVPFVLGSAWLLRQWDRLKNRTALIVAMGLYFAWLAGFDVAYMLYDAWHLEINWDNVEDAVGLPTFLLGLAYLGAVVAATPSADPMPSDAPAHPVSWGDRVGRIEQVARPEDRP